MIKRFMIAVELDANLLLKNYSNTSKILTGLRFVARVVNAAKFFMGTPSLVSHQVEDFDSMSVTHII